MTFKTYKNNQTSSASSASAARPAPASAPPGARARPGFGAGARAYTVWVCLWLCVGAFCSSAEFTNAHT